MEVNMEEQWKPIPGFEGYEVSDRGRVRSYWERRGRGKGNGKGCDFFISDEPQRIMSTNGRIGRTGYPAVNLKGNVYPVHRLVLLAFVGPLPDGLESRHLDGNPENNKLSNLCYGTASENTNDMYEHLDHERFRKLTNKEAASMRRMAANGATKQELADTFGVSGYTVTKICLGRAYDDASGPIVRRITRKSVKLTDEQVVEIRRKLKAGAVGRDLAYQYDVSESMISRIKSGERRENCYAKTNQD